MIGIDRQGEEDRVTASLGGLAFTLALVVAVLFLTRHLMTLAGIENCIESGRTNCMVIDTAKPTAP